MKIQAVRGMKDVLPPQVHTWQRIEAAARRVLGSFGYQELRIPVLEKTELFARSIGETTDIVEKEMYTFSDRSGDSLTMRPEATAGVLRAYVQHKLYATPGPHKYYVLGPMFRHERPQKGRLRQFHQLDVEALDDQGPLVDAEQLVMLEQLLGSLGLEQVELVINSLGDRQCRPAYRQALIEYFSPLAGRLCPDCSRRLERNPLRVLDCKVESCQEVAAGAPAMAEHLCAGCREHFAAVRMYLDEAQVPYRVDSRLVRGLDYYVRTTFEMKAGALGAQDAVAGGGRYDGLIAELGGPDQAATGFALGMERLALLLEAGRASQPGPDLYLAALGEEAMAWAFGQARELRRRGLWVEMPSAPNSLKAQMRRAHKLGAARVLIVGPEELAQGSAALKEMAGGEQRRVPLEGVAETLSRNGI